MKGKKICILGYDGLDCHLVKKFDLENLKQKEYGEIDISSFEIKSSPVLWTSFITGTNTSKWLNPPKNQIKRYRFLKGIIKKLHRYLPRLTDKLRLIINKYSTGTKVMKVPEGRWNFNPKEHGLSTIFNFTDTPLGINVPGYSINREGEKRKKIDKEFKDGMIEKVFQNQLNPKIYEEKVMNDEQKVKFALLNKIKDKEKYNLIMAYFRAPDLLGHVYRSNLEKMKEIYEWFDELTKKVKEGFDGWVLIVSDHGMEPLGRYGDHTDVDYAYYSSNIELGLENPKLTDFYDIIKEKIKG